MSSLFFEVIACFLSSEFRRPGGDLLSHTLRCSTIGAEGFHGRVRDGIGCMPLAITTRSAKLRERKVSFDTLFKMNNVLSGRNADKYLRSLFTRRLQVRAQTPNFIYGPASILCSLRVVVSPDLTFLRRQVTGGLGVIKPIERLVLVSCTCCHASTSSLSTWWSSTALRRDLVSRGVSRLDAFSGYPFRT